MKLETAHLPTGQIMAVRGAVAFVLGPILIRGEIAQLSHSCSPRVLISAVSPLRYSIVLTPLIAGALVFGEWPGIFASLGIGAVVLSGACAIRLDATQRKAATQDA